MGWIEEAEEWTDRLIEGRMDLDQQQFGGLWLIREGLISNEE